MTNTKNRAIEIPNYEQLIESHADLECCSFEDFIAKHEGRIQAFEYQPFTVQGLQLAFHDGGTMLPLAYFLDENNNPILVVVAEIKQSPSVYSLGTIDVQTGESVLAGAGHLYHKHGRCYELNQILGHLINYGRIVNFAEGLKQEAGYELVKLESKNGTTIFFGKIVHDTESETVYSIQYFNEKNCVRLDKIQNIHTLDHASGRLMSH